MVCNPRTSSHDHNNILDPMFYAVRVAVRESGKTVLDAMIGEVLVTCEKLAWVND